MTDTKFACAVCGNVFSEHRAEADSPEAEELIACPRCGSNRVEPDPFDPDALVENPLEPPEGEEAGS
jgi:DNA-directed RNA polymerase subunit RPC12/RpoP